MVTVGNQIMLSQQGKLYRHDFMDVTSQELIWIDGQKCSNTSNFTKRKEKKNLELTKTRKIGRCNEFQLL